ncbi:MAG TPA: hypothetical protein VFY53_01985, partial [Rhodoplanes sp.]|nr:hypothetical protein [Rhodoplanes sp.]
TWMDGATKIIVFVAQIFAVILVVAALFDWRKAYNALGLAHIGQVPTVIRCSKDDFDFGNIDVASAISKPSPVSSSAHLNCRAVIIASENAAQLGGCRVL